MACTIRRTFTLKNVKPSGKIFKLAHYPFPELAQNSVPLC
jgi:hypothetical protein